jgi:cyclase
MKRIIPILLLKDRLVYKTKNFNKPQYIGDPFIALKIFNEKEVDELFVLDIDKSSHRLKPDFEFLEKLASEAFMPLGYGGGINNIEDAKTIFQIGFEKIIINTAISNNVNVVKEISSVFGSQAVVASIDYKYNFFGKRYCCFKNGEKSSSIDPKDLAIAAVDAGAGEILLQCVSYEGKMNKMDLNFIEKMVKNIEVPIVGSGGAPSHDYIKEFFEITDASGLAAGSIFVYYGPHNAVLINYPSYDKKNQLLNTNI